MKVEGTSNRAEPSSFSLNGGHLLPRWRLWRPSIGKGDESYKWEWGRHRLVNLFVKIVSKRSKWKLFMQFWQSVAIMFSPWKGPVWAESTRKICFRIFINKGWKRTLGSWSWTRCWFLLLSLLCFISRRKDVLPDSEDAVLCCKAFKVEVCRQSSF